jgi:hypothetical protein
MSTVDYPPVYDDLVELLANSAKPEEVLSFSAFERQAATVGSTLVQESGPIAVAAGL